MLYNLLEVFLFGLWRHGGDSDDDVHNEDDDGGKTMAKMAMRKQTNRQKYNIQWSQ